MIPVVVEGLGYWPAGARPLLHGISLGAAPGEVLGVLGPNGAGKSCLLRCLYGAARPSAGRILLGQRDAARLSVRERARIVAAVPQDSPPDLQLTVREVIETGRTAHVGPFFGADPGGPQAVAKAIARLGLQDFAGRRFETLSGGERKRVLVARALAQEAPVLVLDEPVNHLDIRHQLELMDLVRRLAATVIVSLHDFELAARYCDRLAVLDRGRLVAEGPPREVLSPGLLARVFGIAARVSRGAADGLLRIHAEPLPDPLPPTMH